MVFPCLPLPSPGFVGIHRSCGRELSSLSSFDSRFAVLFLPYGACFCRETWNRYPDRPGNLESAPTLVGKPGIDEGRWYEAAGGDEWCGECGVRLREGDECSTHFQFQGFSASVPRAPGRFPWLPARVRRHVSPCLREVCRALPSGSRFAVLFLSYDACFCRETWNRPLRSSENLD